MKKSDRLADRNGGFGSILVFFDDVVDAEIVSVAAYFRVSSDFFFVGKISFNFLQDNFIFI